ncbi:unnamed protein product [Lactuca saligna]|uniref:Uncharacterized protein n=1 Tax=Lactuca saligna TaxID=75948 RepID=A0AA35ZQR4_LACSI|nr:unnamed protein product [Lactuca saligna]
MRRPILDHDISHWTRGGVRDGVRGVKTFGGVEDGGMAQVEEEDPPQTETQDGVGEIIHETQPESEEEEEEEGINETQELPLHLMIVKRIRLYERIVKTKLKKIGCVGTSANSVLELD